MLLAIACDACLKFYSRKSKIEPSDDSSCQVKFTLEEAQKSQRESTGIDLLLL
jgi:hypothetical protein